MKKLFPKTNMFEEAKRQSKGHFFIVEILLFLLVMLVTSIVASLPLLPLQISDMAANPEMIDIITKFNASEITMEEYTAEIIAFQASKPIYTIISLFSTGITTLLTFAYCRFIEKRRLSTMGFRKNKFLPEYLVGMLIGIVMFSLSVGICLIFGALNFDGVVQNIKWGIIGLYFVGFLIQGMSEEVVFRGYFMMSVSRRSHVAVAIALSSIAFGCAHLGNTNVSVLAVVNICLFGLFEGLYILKRGNIWGACGIHSLWNFVQGNFYGISVSGIITADSILTMSPVDSKSLINGGGFGLEGGLAVTIVTIISIIAITLTKTKSSEIFDEENAPIIEPAITEE